MKKHPWQLNVVAMREEMVYFGTFKKGFVLFLFLDWPLPLNLVDKLLSSEKEYGHTPYYNFGSIYILCPGISLYTVHCTSL